MDFYLESNWEEIEKEEEASREDSDGFLIRIQFEIARK